MISLDDFFKGRQQAYRSELTDVVRTNSVEMVRRANLLLNSFYRDNPGAATRTVNSGWRPPSLNARVPGAARFSLHMVGAAVDLSDDDAALDTWLTSPNGMIAIEQIDLWVEEASHTPRWSHIQIFPPRSRRRFFHP